MVWFGLCISQLKYLNRENTKRTLLQRKNDGEISIQAGFKLRQIKAS
jgi:hypothetical protein